MLSILWGEAPDVFKQVLEFYVEPYSSILDLTYGNGKMWRSLDERYTMHLTTNDVDPESPSQFHVPFHQIADFLKGVRKGLLNIDAAIYDPPYKYEQPSHYLRLNHGGLALHHGENDLDWKANKTKWMVQDQVSTAEVLNTELPKILRDGGSVIVKIMNTRLKGNLIANDRIIIDAFTNFSLFDQVVYVRTLTGLFHNIKRAQVAHGFYLIFKKI